VEEAKLRAELNAERGVMTTRLEGGAEATKSP
jgi:N utilization substance protein A